MFILHVHGFFCEVFKSFAHFSVELSFSYQFGVLFKF